MWGMENSILVRVSAVLVNKKPRVETQGDLYEILEILGNVKIWQMDKIKKPRPPRKVPGQNYVRC